MGLLCELGFAKPDSLPTPRLQVGYAKLWGPGLGAELGSQMGGSLVAVGFGAIIQFRG